MHVPASALPLNAAVPIPNDEPTTSAPAPYSFDRTYIDIDAIPSPAHSPYPGSMPGLMTASADSDEDAEEMAEDAPNTVSFSTASHVYTFVYDIYVDARERIRQAQEQRLMAMEVGRNDPSVLVAAMWGAYMTIADLVRQPVTAKDEADFAETAKTLMPFFELLSERFHARGLDQQIQVVHTNDCIDPDSDIVVFKTNSLRRRLQNLKEKYQSITIDRIEGFRPKGNYKREDVEMAHTAQHIISLHMGGSSYVQAPFPPHLLRDAFAIRRYEKMCVPGTIFFENMPGLIRKMRLFFLLCIICGGSHAWNASECRRKHVEERLLISEGYSEVDSGPCTLYFPEHLRNSIKYHAQHYMQVFPGSVFLFDRVPLALIAARKEFRVCEACGIFHRTTLASPLHLHCPYDLNMLAQRFVRDTHQFEAENCTPPMYEWQPGVDA
jgi:hypothetical protein